MIKKIIIIVLLIFAMNFAFANFENYNGETKWTGNIIINEERCKSGIKTDKYQLTIKHDGPILTIQDNEHFEKPLKAALRGNVITAPDTTVQEQYGSSLLYSIKFEISEDCTKITGGYLWNYTYGDYSCKGETTIDAVRIDGKSCPGEPVITEDDRAKIEEEEKNIETKKKTSQEILAQNPNDFWANWDMAEINKDKGNYNEYYKYFSKALENESLRDDTRAELKKEAARQLNLSEFPTEKTSPLLRIERGQVAQAQGQTIYNFKVPQEKESVLKKIGTILWHMFAPRSYNILEKLASTEIEYEKKK